SRFAPDRYAAGKTRRSSPPGRRSQSATFDVAAATQANTRDLAEWHVDHTAHSQLAVVRSTFSHGRGFSANLKELDLISELFAQLRSNGNVRFESKADIEVS